MTQSFNLSQLANNLTSSGLLDASDGLVNAVPIANGGTGATSVSAARTNLNVPSTTGGSASGTWGISITGNSASTTSLSGGSVNATSGDFSGTLNGVRGNFKNYSDLQSALTVTNATYGYGKHFRVGNSNDLNIVNSAYTATILTLSDAGALATPSTLSSSNLFANSVSGQLNVDYSGLLALNTLFVNSYAYPILVNISCKGAGNFQIQAYSNGVSVGVANCNTAWSSITFIVQSGHGYQVNSSGSLEQALWSIMR